MGGPGWGIISPAAPKVSPGPNPVQYYKGEVGGRANVVLFVTDCFQKVGHHFPNVRYGLGTPLHTHKTEDFASNEPLGSSGDCNRT